MDADDDAFLYGEPVDKRQKLEGDGPDGASTPVAKPAEPNEAATSGNASKTKDDTADGRGDDDEESSEESDSDLEVIIDTNPGVRAEQPQTDGLQSLQMGRSLAGTAPQGTAAAAPQQSALQQRQAQPDQSIALPAVDLDSVAELDGKPLYNVDLSELPEQPWRRPGADIADYFNYGFDEFTWSAYCSKQSTLRAEYKPAKFMADMMAQMGGPGMGMPPPDFQAMMGGGGGNIGNVGGMQPMIPLGPMGSMPAMDGPRDGMGDANGDDKTATLGGDANRRAGSVRDYASREPEGPRAEREARDRDRDRERSSRDRERDRERDFRDYRDRERGGRDRDRDRDRDRPRRRRR